MWYRVKIGKAGEVKSVEQTETEYNVSGVYTVEAKSEKAARVIALQLHREYSRRVVAERRKALAKEGKCRCGREYPEGYQYKHCDVCRERQKANRLRGETSATGRRDEAARAEKCSARVRDRKSEMKLEVLCQVRRAWEDARTNGEFTRWLAWQIKREVERPVQGDS